MHLSTPPFPSPRRWYVRMLFYTGLGIFFSSSSLQVANNKQEVVCSYWSWIFQETLVHSSSVCLYLLSMNWQKCSSKVTSSVGVYIFSYCNEFLKASATLSAGSLKNSTIVTLHVGIRALGSHTQLLCPSLSCGSRISCLEQSESVS